MDVPDLLTIGDARELLGDDANSMSDAEIDDVRRSSEHLAHLLIDCYLAEHCLAKSVVPACSDK